MATMITLKIICNICGEEFDVDVFSDDYLSWLDGELAQNAFPYLAPEARELLISGICPQCWKNMFCYGEEVEDDE